MTDLPDSSPKTVQGARKPACRAVPPIAIFEMGRAMEDGANKYGPFNWRVEPITASTYYNALQRHVMAWWDGEDYAEDSGLHHLSHAMACLAILIDAQACKVLTDNRPPAKGPTAAYLRMHTRDLPDTKSRVEP